MPGPEQLLSHRFGGKVERSVRCLKHSDDVVEISFSDGSRLEAAQNIQVHEGTIGRNDARRVGRPGNTNGMSLPAGSATAVSHAFVTERHPSVLVPCASGQ
jgi:hypothetical protein